jgi:hypothetical protein
MNKRYVMTKAVTRAITHGIQVERNEFGMTFTAPEGMSAGNDDETFCTVDKQCRYVNVSELSQM